MPRSDQGSTTDRYTVIPRVLVFVYNNGDVLLIKGAPDKRLWANRYNGLGGHVKAGEDMYHAARREVCEEAGLELRDLWLRGVVHIDVDAPPGIVLFCFSARSERREVRPSQEGSLHWISPDRLSQVDLVEDVPVLLERLAQDEGLGRQAPPFSARYWYDDEDRLRIEFAH
jgi:8-oxo-dGTP diphosphatase